MYPRRDFNFKKAAVQCVVLGIFALLILYTFAEIKRPTAKGLTNDSPEKQMDTQTQVLQKESFNILIQTHATWLHSVERRELKYCPDTKCHFTTNQKYLNSTSDYDGILFLGQTDLPLRLNEVKEFRTAEQLYIVLLSESPDTVRPLEREDLDDVFNMTMGYRLDSDSHWEYGGFIEKLTNEKISPAYQPKWRPYNEVAYNGSFVAQSDIPEVVAGKEKMVAWFVSNCHSTSNRMELAKAIQQYIPVDIYGGCGPLKCSRSNSECREMLERDYMFYLSFENSLCEDYITEKVFLNMNRTIIPIIYNGAEVNRFLPPHSYINVEDYPSVKELTDYMLFLADNPGEYMSYFWWKEHYFIRRSYFPCELCEKIAERASSQESFYHKHLKDWFFKDACRTPKKKFT